MLRDPVRPSRAVRPGRRRGLRGRGGLRSSSLRDGLRSRCGRSDLLRLRHRTAQRGFEPLRHLREILIAAEIAEALAVTTYTNIIKAAPFFANLKREQATKLKEALQRGEPDTEGILANARETRARELV